MSWIVYAIISVIAASLMYITEKKSLLTEHATEFSALKALLVSIMGVFLIPLMDLKIDPLLVAFIYLSSVLGAFGIVYKNRSVRHMELSDVAPFINTSPIFLIIMAFLFLGETITIMQFSGIVMLLLGSYILEMDHSYKDLLRPLKMIVRSRFILYFIFAQFIFSICQVIEKFVVDSGVSALSIMFLVWLFITINLNLVLLLRYNGLSDLKHGIKKCGRWVLLAAFLTIIASFTYYKAISLAYVSLVVPIRRLSSLLTTVIGGELFHDHGLAHKIAACTIMVIGAIMVAL